MNQLTPQEQKIVALIAQGLTNKEIAQRLGSSPLTVWNRVKLIMLKSWERKMDTSEVIAVIRDISIIILIGLWLIGMVAAGVIGIRIYRLVKRIVGRVKEGYQTIRSGLVRPLLRMRSRVSSLSRILSRVPSRVRQQFQAHEGGMRISKSNLIVVVTGVSVGVLAGLLLAPKPGRETRQMLKSQSALKDRAGQHATSLRRR
jgi:hypothetical protein